jgi:hypothetical protein
MANKLMDRMEQHIDDYNKAPEDEKQGALNRIKKSIGPIESGINSPEFEKLPDDIKNRAKEILKKVKEIESPASANKGDRLEGPSQPHLLTGPDKKTAPKTDTEEETPKDSKKELKDFIRAVPRYASTTDPERLKKFLSTSLGALTGAVVWMMKAENEKGGSATEVFTSTVADKWKKIADSIKSKKAAADQINQMVKEAAADMQELIQSVSETRMKAKHAFEVWSEQNHISQSFDEYANPRRMSAAKHDIGKIGTTLDETNYKFLMSHISLMASIEGFDENIKQGLNDVLKTYRKSTEYKKSFNEVVDRLGKMNLPYDIIKPIFDENLGDPKEIKAKIEAALQEDKAKKAPQPTNKPTQQPQQTQQTQQKQP